MENVTINKIKRYISENNVFIFMKGTPDEPRCGFSSLAINILNACGVNYKSADVLSEQDIRRVLPEYAEWPTFPQVYINGELIGGSDILQEQFNSGELQSLLKET